MKFAEIEIVKLNVNDVITASEVACDDEWVCDNEMPPVFN